MLLNTPPKEWVSRYDGETLSVVLIIILIFLYLCIIVNTIPQLLSLHPGAPRFALRSGLFPLDCVVTPTPRSSPEIPKTEFPVGRSQNPPLSEKSQNLPKISENLRKIAKFGGSILLLSWTKIPPSPQKIPPKFWGGFPKNLKKRGYFPTQNRGFFPKSGLKSYFVWGSKD